MEGNNNRETISAEDITRYYTDYSRDYLALFRNLDFSERSDWPRPSVINNQSVNDGMNFIS